MLCKHKELHTCTYMYTLHWTYASKAQKKRFRFLVISQLQDRCCDVFFFFFFFFLGGGGILFFANQWNTWYMYKFPIHKEASQIIHTPMWKSHLKHSTAEFAIGHRFQKKKNMGPRRCAIHGWLKQRICFWRRKRMWYVHTVTLSMELWSPIWKGISL